MHLAASLLVLRQTRAAAESAPFAESPARNISSLPSAVSPSDLTQSPKQGSMEDPADGANATSGGHDQMSLACIVDGAARASVVATELSDAPMVNLVAGVLDAEATLLREEAMGDFVKTKLKS